tara:strand:- start:1178 stop:1414 length:237 start_codon:yes stop_codon:yes gene_type:complete
MSKAMDKLVKELQDNPEKFERLQKIRYILPMTKVSELTVDVICSWDDNQLDYFIMRTNKMMDELGINHSDLVKVGAMD